MSTRGNHCGQKPERQETRSSCSRPRDETANRCSMKEKLTDEAGVGSIEELKANGAKGHRRQFGLGVDETTSRGDRCSESRSGRTGGNAATRSTKLDGLDHRTAPPVINASILPKMIDTGDNDRCSWRKPHKAPRRIRRGGLRREGYSLDSPPPRP